MTGGAEMYVPRQRILIPTLVGSLFLAGIIAVFLAWLRVAK